MDFEGLLDFTRTTHHQVNRSPPEGAVPTRGPGPGAAAPPDSSPEALDLTEASRCRSRIRSDAPHNVPVSAPEGRRTVGDTKHSLISRTILSGCSMDSPYVGGHRLSWLEAIAITILRDVHWTPRQDRPGKERSNMTQRDGLPEPPMI